MTSHEVISKFPLRDFWTSKREKERKGEKKRDRVKREGGTERETGGVKRRRRRKMERGNLIRQ